MAGGGRVWQVDFLSAVFGISSWLSVNGLFVSLPLLVAALPEGWKLASFMAVIVQVANLGPIGYSLLRWRHPEIRSDLVIVSLLSLGTLASVLLVFYWDAVAMVGGSLSSVGLLTLLFFLSLVDCTSSVLFVPFMASLRPRYLTSYLVGEGLSGLIPAAVALAQGVGGNPRCLNVTRISEETGETVHVMEAVSPPPRFSVEVFFSVMAALMLASLIAFCVLVWSSAFDSERCSKGDKEEIGEEEEEEEEDSGELSMKELEKKKGIEKEEVSFHPLEAETSLSPSSFKSLLALQCFVCFVSNGALPSVQTYSCLPFGNAVYHLSVALHAMANPAAASAAYFFSARRPRDAFAAAAAGGVFAAFIMATALASPRALGGGDFGGAMTVLSWVTYGFLFSYVKVSVAGMCRPLGGRALFWFGAWTQVGSAAGSFLFFALINFTGMFVPYNLDCSQ